MTTREKVRKLARKLGVIVDTERFELLAPDGYRFKATETHSIVFEPQIPVEEFVPGGQNRRPNKAEVELGWKSALADLEFGLEPCPADCNCPL
jgi:hypothetical protein